MPEEKFAGTAYSYIRFSSREQEQGDSIRRQRSLRDDWLAKHPAVTLDTAFGGEDRGVSAFRGRNRSDKHHLGRFLDAVRNGKVKAGSILLLESLDRLSRQEEEEALALLLSLLNAGIVIVQLEPYTVFKKGDGMIGLMRALIYLSRAREESATKSARMRKAWQQKQADAQKEKKIVSKRCPAWLEIESGKFRFKPGAQATLRRIFRRCLDGQGGRMIAADLHEGGVPHFEGGRWSNVYVGHILRCPSVAGRYQAMHRVSGKRVPNGPPVDGYFPAAVSLADWHAAQQAMKARKKKGGRRGVGGWVALFSPVADARTGERLHAVMRVDRQNGRRYHVLQPADVLRWQGKCVSFPLDSFERGVRARLRELDASAVFPAPESSDRVTELRGQLADTEARRTRLQAAMVDGDEDEAALPVLRQLVERVKKLAAGLAEAERAEGNPARHDWQAMADLDAAIDTDPETRLRYRAVAGRLIERIDVLIVAQARSAMRRLAAVQIRFKDSAQARGCYIAHRNANHGPGRTQVPAGWVLLSRPFPPDVDLRDRESAKRFEQTLAKIDLTKLV